MLGLLTIFAIIGGIALLLFSLPTLSVACMLLFGYLLQFLGFILSNLAGVFLAFVIFCIIKAIIKNRKK